MNKEALWLELGKRSHEVETDMDSLHRKRTGSYYTDLRLTDVMMSELVEHLLKSGKKISECTFFEPCVGAGNFVFSYLKMVSTLSLSRDEIESVINNLYVADINKNALEKYRESLSSFAKAYWDISLEKSYFNEHIGSGLLVDVSADELTYIRLEDVFGKEVAERKFDIVVTNPPYKNLKAERTQYATEEEYCEDKDKYASVSKLVNKNFKYSTDGVLNLYKLFVEEIIDRYANADAYVSLLIPASLMSDKTCEKLRTHILMEKNLLSAKVISEGSGYIDAQQALVAILLGTKGKTKKVRITKDFCHSPNDNADVDIDDILNPNTGNSLIALSEDEYHKYKILRTFPVVKDLSFITNLRGELDLTAGKGFIVQEQTSNVLLRGRNIGYYELLDMSDTDYVEPEFLEKTKKSVYVNRDRIICQQIANMHKERRVTFALAKAGYVLGNSCNFISVEENEYGIDIYALLGLFNTKIINWLFKLTSSNNHINNYEIDCFPVPINASELKEISLLSQQYLQAKDDRIIDKIEILAERAFGLNQTETNNMSKNDENVLVKTFLKDINYLCPDITYEEAEKIVLGEDIKTYVKGDISTFDQNVINGIVEKYRNLYAGVVLNHTTFKLSDLDLEMIKSVPQGGSWKDIPAETVAKSKRLLRITETGGRTTLYGRIDYSKPSYTITTYFNRPGNGTYVHPIHERVLSVREAARFQGFQDDYLFFGNKTQLLKQVGNAVPTIFAYQLGKRIIEKTGCSKSIDLFCGAGGMTAGFKGAGIQSMLSNDIEESAVTTLKINNPEINVLCGDITEEKTKDVLIETAQKTGADIICGGPPCQGFSMAGYRDENDPRNQLFREFVYVVEHIKPKVIVFENVEGLLSYQGGKTYRDIHTLFGELGYNTEGRALMTNLYGVPQKRKRVIIICTRKDLDIQPSELYPDEITTDESRQVTARETIGDLEQVPCDKKATYIDGEETDIVKFFKKKISYEEYINTFSKSDAGSSDLNNENHEVSEIKMDAFGQLSFA